MNKVSFIITFITLLFSSSIMIKIEAVRSSSRNLKGSKSTKPMKGNAQSLTVKTQSKKGKAQSKTTKAKSGKAHSKKGKAMTTTQCLQEILVLAAKELGCSSVAAIQWLLTTNEGIKALQDYVNAAQGMTWEQINDKYEEAHTNTQMLSKKSGKTAKGSINLTKCPIDPALNCEILEAMVWFLTTDEGISSLKGTTTGMSLTKINQRYALVSFYYGLNAASRKELKDDYGWLVGDECDWGGTNGIYEEVPIQCDNNGRLTKIVMTNMGLQGTLSPELGRITTLTIIYLHDNQLVGEIPTQLGQLSSLDKLYLANNQLRGKIPKELAQLSNLTVLYLNNNQLSGEIPTELGQLSMLYHLSLANNQLVGEIPTELGQLSNLVTLYLHVNELSGEIPTKLGQLSTLRFLQLYWNDLGGSMPTAICNLRPDPLIILTADCHTLDPEVTCTCCTLCPAPAL